MANSELQGKTFNIPDNVKNHLSKIFNAYKGDQTVEGFGRLRTLTSKDSITYEQIKRIKNFFDTYTGKRNDTPYLLNGGTIMKEWVNSALEDARQNIKGKKTSMSDIGMDNQFIDDHSKDGVRIDSHDSDVKKILRKEGIYNMGIMNDLINTINKNKQLWHTEHRFHQF